MKTVELGHGYRLVARDQMNWELQQWREPAEDKGGRVAKSREAKWRSCGRFYQTLDSALHAVYELVLREGDGAADLREAVEEARRVAETLNRNVGLLAAGGAR